MPLDEEQQDKLQILKGDLKNLSDSIKTMTGQLDDQAVLSKLVTGGKKPDYDKFSTQDLQELYDRGVRSSAINTLPDGIDPVTQQEIAPPHDHSVIATASRGEATSDLSRDQLISGIDAMLENEGYNFDPQRIATAQGMMVNAQAAMTDGGVDRAMLSYIKLQEEVPGFQDKDFESRLDAVKKEAAQFSQLTEKKCSDYVHAGLSTKLNELGGMKGSNAAQVDAALKTAQRGLDPTNFSGASKHMGRASQEHLNLSGMNLTGIDLSASNLTGIRVDATSLSRAKGLENVQGVEPRLLAEAHAIKPHVARLDDLNERMAKLENKGGVVANLRNLRHGGVEGERKHIEKEIEKAQQALQQSKAGVAARFAAPQNEFEQKNVYQVGADVTRRAEAPKDPRLEAMQASVTFRLDSDSAMNDQGSKVAFAKTQIGTKSGDLRAAGRSEKDVGDALNQEFNAFGNVAALHGTMAAVNRADFTNTEAMKAAVGSDITTLLTRSVATSAVDKALGMNAMAEEKIGIDEQGRHVGISVGVPGAPILKRPDNLEANETCLNIRYDDPNVQKGLYDLQAQDYITGQIDRHTGNIFVDPHSGQVSGIDNDLAFPTIDREQMITQSNLSAKVIAGKPQFLHEDTADKIEALKPETLRAALESIELPEGVAPLETAAIDGAVQRLQELQAEIKEMRKDGRVVQKFDDNTYQKALERQQAITPDQPLGTGGTVIKTSYLAAAVIEQKKSIGMGQGRDLATKDDIPKPQVDAKFAAYQKGVEDARANIAANPGQLQDAGLAKTITDGQAKLMKLQDDLQTHDQNLTASLARLNQSRLKGDPEVTAGLEEIVDHAQKARQETLQELKSEQQKVSAALDQAVEPMKPRIAAQARLATEQQQVGLAQPQNEIEANADDQKLEASGEVKLEDSGEVKLEASGDIPLTQSQIDAIENEFANLEEGAGEIELEASGELQIEGEHPGIEINELPNEEQGIEAEVNNQKQDQPAVEAPANEQGQEGPAKHKSKFASVRDSLKGLASTAKSAVAQKLEKKGDEQSLHAVSPEKQAEYKALQKKLSDLKGGGDAIKAAGLLGPDPKAHKDFKSGAPDGGMTAPQIQEKMDALKKEFPGLKQLDRSKVGQVVNTAVREGSKAVGTKLKG